MLAARPQALKCHVAADIGAVYSGNFSSYADLSDWAAVFAGPGDDAGERLNYGRLRRR